MSALALAPSASGTHARSVASSAHHHPRVVVIDLDGTLVGKVNAIVCEHELVRAHNAKAFKAFRDSVVARLRYGIIRPHFHAFCKHASAARLELFIYTASEARWAAFLVPCVEAALGIKFNRPIFTRDHCLPDPVSGDIRKSLSRIAPAIFSRLKKRHGLRRAEELKDRMLLVDNTPGIMISPAEAAKLVVCPTYTYSYTHDVLARLDVDTMHRHFLRLIPALVRFNMFPSNVTPASYQQFAAVYHERLAAAIVETQAENAHCLSHDRFWMRLLHALTIPKAVKAFDAEAVQAVERYIRGSKRGERQQQAQGRPHHR